MKGILYNLSIYKKIILFLTVFSGGIILLTAASDVYFLRKVKYVEYKERLIEGKQAFESSLDRMINQAKDMARNRSERHPLVIGLINKERMDPPPEGNPPPRQFGPGEITIIANKDSMAAFSSRNYKPDIFESVKQYIVSTDSTYSGLCVLKSEGKEFLGIIGVAPIPVIEEELYLMQILKIDNKFCDIFKETTDLNSTIWIQDKRYATSDIDEDGNRILNIDTDTDIISNVLQKGDTVTVNTDLLSRRDFSLISPLEDLFGNRVGMFGVGLDADELAAGQRRIVFENILIEFIIFLLVILFSIILAKKLTTPLVAFRKMAASISVGNYNLPEFPITGEDELNILRSAFNRMMREIRERDEREKKFKLAQERRLSELTVLNDIATVINVNQDIDVILKHILDKTTTVIDTPYGLTILSNRKGNVVKYISFGFPDEVKLEALSENIISKLKQEKKITTLELDSGSGIDGYFSELKLARILCIPFLKDGDVSGSLCFFLKESHEPLSEEQFSVLNIIAENSVRVIDNARLYQSERERELLKQEMELARSVQQNLLSHDDLKISTFDFVTHNTPSFEVSGDYYDVIKLDDDRVMVSIADVSGKGMSAALLMANLQAAVHSLIYEQYSIDELVRKLNNLIFSNTKASSYITFFISIINVDTGSMEYVNAGHNPPMIFRCDRDNNTEYLKPGGLLLGWLKDTQYSKGTEKMDLGDVLLLYTDGVTEAMNLNEEEYGEERLINEIIANRELSCGEIKSAVLSSIAKFTGSIGQSDDITMVIVKKIR